MEERNKSRRKFINRSTKIGLGLSLFGLCACTNTDAKKDSGAENKGQPWFKISLAQWSLHKMLQAGDLDNLDFAKFTKSTFNIDAIEYVSRFFEGNTEKKYLQELNSRAQDQGVKQLLIMVDDEGDLGNTDDMERKKAVLNHYKWVATASALGCHSIRVNAFGEGSREDVSSAAIDGLSALGNYAHSYDLNVIVENHGSYSSDGKWLSNVIRQVGLPNVGTLPDFGNFCIEREGGKRWGAPCVNEYDRYRGTKEMMSFAKGVSAKTHEFNADGEETKTNYKKMLRIVKDAGYNGYIGIEYEGENLTEVEGILKTKALLEKYNV